MLYSSPDNNLYKDNYIMQNYHIAFHTEVFIGDDCVYLWWLVKYLP